MIFIIMKFFLILFFIFDSNFCIYRAKGEWGFVEDDKHDEERRKFDHDYINVFEDSNFDTFR